MKTLVFSNDWDGRLSAFTMAFSMKKAGAKKVTMVEEDHWIYVVMTY